MKIFLSSVKFLSIFLLLTCISDKSRSLSSQDSIDSRSANLKNDFQSFKRLWNEVVGSEVVKSECKSNFPFTENNKTYNVAFKNEITGHKITDDGKERILHIGKCPLEGKWIKKFLIDSKCHPYTSGKKTIRLKKIQEQAIASAQVNIQKNKKWLYVAPTGSGKTEVIKAVLEEDLKKNEKNKKNLSILVVDTLLLRDQLHKDLQENNYIKSNYQFVLWGKNEENATLIQSLNLNKKTILITTAQSLVLDRVWDNESVNYLNNNLALFYYDEAHHAFEGTNRIELINKINQMDDVIKRYFTATPTQELLSKMAGKSFFAYLDTPEDFLLKGERRVTEIVEQLKIAIDEGELAPFFDFYFIQELGGAASLTEIHKKLTEAKIFFEKRNKGFFSVPRVKQAVYLSEITRYPFLVGVDNYDKRQVILEEFSNEKFPFIITCELFNEGLNIPKMNTVIDLNALNPKESSFRSFFQKIGRVLRLYPGKDSVTIASLFFMNEAMFVEWFEFIDELKDGSFGIKSYDNTQEEDEKKKTSKKRKNRFQENVEQLYSEIEVTLEKKNFFQQFDKNLLSTFSELLIAHQQSFTDFMIMKGRARDDYLSVSKDAQKFFKIYFQYKWDIESTENKDKYTELRYAISTLYSRDFSHLKERNKPPEIRLYNVFLQACKAAKDQQGKDYNCNEQGNIKQFFEDHIKFDTSSLETYLDFIQKNRKGMDDFMVSKGSKEAISTNTQTFLESYFQYKWAIKNIENKDKYTELREAISTLSSRDFKDLQASNKPSQLRFYNVFFQACQVAIDPQGKKYNCNKQGNIKQFFEDHIKFDTLSLETYVTLIQDYEEHMNNFMVSKGRDESLSKTIKTYLEVYFQYKWDIESTENKDKYTELSDAISTLSSRDFGELKKRSNKPSQLRFYNIFFQACQVAIDPQGNKYNCNNNDDHKRGIKNFFEDHIKFDTSSLETYVDFIQKNREGMDDFMVSKGSNDETTSKDTKTFLEAYFQDKWAIQGNDKYTELSDAISVLYKKDFHTLNQSKPSQIRLYNVFFHACKVAKDLEGEKYDCNKQKSIKNFFEDHIEFDTSSLETYLAFIQKNRKGMNDFMASKGSNETISKNTKTFLKACFQYKWAIENTENKDKYTELRKALEILLPPDFNGLKSKTSKIRLYSVFFQACQTVKNKEGRNKYNCQEELSIKQFFEDHIEFKK